MIERQGRHTTPCRHQTLKRSHNSEPRDEAIAGSLKKESETFFTNECLPGIHFFNELLIPEKPATRLNPLFIRAITKILDEHGFYMQPSWLSVPLGRDSKWELLPSGIGSEHEDKVVSVF